MENRRSLFRSKLVHTVVIVSPTGDLDFVQHESPSDTLLRVRSEHRAHACRALLGDDARVNGEAFALDDLQILDLIVRKFASQAEDPYEQIRMALKNGGVEFNESIWSNS